MIFGLVFLHSPERSWSNLLLEGGSSSSYFFFNIKPHSSFSLPVETRLPATFPGSVGNKPWPDQALGAILPGGDLCPVPALQRAVGRGRPGAGWAMEGWEEGTPQPSAFHAAMYAGRFNLFSTIIFLPQKPKKAPMQGIDDPFQSEQILPTFLRDRNRNLGNQAAGNCPRQTHTARVLNNA